MSSKKLLMGVAAAVLAVGTAAEAAFVVTSTRTTVGNNDVIVFRALNTGTDNTGDRVLATSVQLTALQSNLIFKIVDADGDGVDDADVNLRSVVGGSPTPAQITGSYIRFGSPSSFLIGGNLPEGYSDANGDGNTDPGGDQRVTFFQNTKSFRVDGFNGSGGIVANTGQGVQFAGAVVPKGVTVTATGTIAGATGSAQAFSNTNEVPEPVALGFIGLGAMALLGRRRRTI